MGSQVERVASFLGRRIEYVNEITELTGTRLAMRSVRSPFPMRVTYGFDDAGNDATKVSVRVEGDASRLYRLADPLMAFLVHRSVQRDLRTLKRLLENGAGKARNRLSPMISDGRSPVAHREVEHQRDRGHDHRPEESSVGVRRLLATLGGAEPDVAGVG